MTRRRSAGLLAAGACAAGAAFGTTAAVGQSDAGDRVLLGALSGAQERGPEGQRNVGDSDGRGSASAVVEDGKLCFGLTVRNLEAPVAAHIHRGRRGENGPVVIPLKVPKAGDPGAVSGCVDVDSRLARQVLRRPERFYWNVHTRAYPNGAIRGQVFTRG